MEFALADELIGDLRRVHLGVADHHATISFLSQVQRLRGFLDALEIEAARRLHELTHIAPAELAKATQRHVRAGDRVYERAATLATVPSLTAPLASGDLQAAHIDTVAKVMRTVDDKHADAFAARLPDLIGDAAATKATPDDLARILNRTARALENDDGMTRFTRQRRDTALHTWTDKRTGMFRLSGRFDPLSGLVVHGHLQAMLAALFAERVPSTCPTNPAAKQDHLRALALLALIMQQHAGLNVVPDRPTTSSDASFAFDPGAADETIDGDDTSDSDPTASTHPSSDTGDSDSNTKGRDVDTADYLDEWADFFRRGPSRLGRPEIVVVVDARQQTLDANDGSPVIDWGLPVEVPPRALHDLFKRADAHPIIVANGIVLHAPGEMNLGRTTRLASRAQRRTLRALYPTCAVPGCCVAFEFTKPHHVHYWEHGGPTDLANLLPLCSKHHHAAHEGGWKLALQPNRTLTITLPDGTIHATGPPVRCQAA